MISLEQFPPFLFTFSRIFFSYFSALRFSTPFFQIFIHKEIPYRESIQPFLPSLIFVSLTPQFFEGSSGFPLLDFSLASTPLRGLLVDHHSTTTTRGIQPCALSRTHPRVVLLSFHLAFTAFAHSPHSTIPEEIRDQNIRHEVLPVANMSSARPTSAAAHRA